METKVFLPSQELLLTLPLDVFSSVETEIDVSAMQQIKQNTHIIYLTPKLDFGIP